MKSSGSNFCNTFLLDMYSNDKNIKYERGEDFLKHSNYFDKFSSYYDFDGVFLGVPAISGGVRNRLCDLKCCLIKRSFFYNNFDLKLSAGYHWVKNTNNNNIKMHPIIEYLLHFKFIKPDFTEFIKKRIVNNQDWNNSSEYKNLEKINLSEIYDIKFSVELKNKAQLNNIFNKFKIRN